MKFRTVFLSSLIICAGGWYLTRPTDLPPPKEEFSAQELEQVARVGFQKNAPVKLPGAKKAEVPSVDPVAMKDRWAEFSGQIGLRQVDDLLLSRGEIALSLRVLLSINRKSEGVESNNEFLLWAQQELAQNPVQSLANIEHALATLSGEEYAVDRAYLIQMVQQVAAQPEGFQGAKQVLMARLAQDDETTQAAGGNTSLLALNAYLSIEQDEQTRAGALAHFEDTHANEELRSLAHNYYSMIQNMKSPPPRRAVANDSNTPVQELTRDENTESH